jgi:hypothetical protein
MDRSYLQLLKEQVKPKGMKDIHAEIVRFLKENPNPSDEKVHKFAEEMGMPHEELERHIYMMLSSAIKKGFLGESSAHLNEIFTQTPSYRALPKGKERDIQMLRTAIIAELDAANLYEQMAHDSQDDDVRDVMLDVANEEKQHVGEFEFLLEHLDEDFERYEDKGEEEAKELTGKGEPPEPEPVEDEEEPTEEG